MNTLAVFAGSSLALLFPQSPPRLSLSDAIHFSEEHSDSLRIARSELDAARARSGQQRSRSLPHLGFSGSATRFDDKTTVSFPGIGSIELLPDHQEQLALAITQDLDLSGQVGASIGQARLRLLSAGYQVETATEDQALTTTTAFYAVNRTAQAVQVARASLDSYKQQLTTTTKLSEGGVGQKIDVYRAQSQVADAERELTRRRNDLSAAQSALNDLIGRPLDAPLDLDEPTSIQDPTEDADLSTLTSKALDRRSEALSARLEVAAAEKGVKVARGINGPSASLAIAGYNYPTTSFQSPRRNVGALTLSVSIPLFDGGLGREQVNEARSLVRSAKANEDRIRRGIALEVQNAGLDLRTARRSLEAAKVALTSAEAARRLAQQRYEAQVGLYLEVTDAQAALTAAQAAVVDATYDLLTAQARLSRALSEPIVPQGTRP